MLIPKIKRNETQMDYCERDTPELRDFGVSHIVLCRHGMFIGVATCSTLDEYDKEIGMEIARERAMSAMFNYISIVSPPFYRRKACAIMRAVADMLEDM